MNSKNKSAENDLSKLLDFKSKKDIIRLQEELLHLKFISVIEQEMNRRNITKSELAEKINTSRSYISQLFTGDKMINIKTLNKIQRAFDIAFDINIVNNRRYKFDMPSCEKLKKIRNIDLYSTTSKNLYRPETSKIKDKEKFPA